LVRLAGRRKNHGRNIGCLRHRLGCSCRELTKPGIGTFRAQRLLSDLCARVGRHVTELAHMVGWRRHSALLVKARREVCLGER
jgi:hypothetical protein